MAPKKAPNSHSKYSGNKKKTHPGPTANRATDDAADGAIENTSEPSGDVREIEDASIDTTAVDNPNVGADSGGRPDSDSTNIAKSPARIQPTRGVKDNRKAVNTGSDVPSIDRQSVLANIYTDQDDLSIQEIERSAQAEHEHVFWNIGHVPSGQGRYMWARPRDAQDAIELDRNLDTPARVVEYRVEHGIAQHRGPHVLWFPDPINFNPAIRPTIPGRFEFHVQADLDLAALNYGGALQGWGLARDPDPGEFWVLRYNQIRAGNEGFGQEINIVWVPDAEDSDSNTSVQRRDRDLIYSVIPTENKDVKDATNGAFRGPLDQTSTHKGRLYSRLRVRLGKKTSVIVMDRSSALKGTPQPHKLWVHGKTGWNHYPNADTMNWSDQGMIRHLNRWRDQHFSRLGLTKKREPPVPYTDEQKEWMRQDIRRRPDAATFGGSRKLFQRFQAAFPDRDATHGAVQAFRERLAKEMQKAKEKDQREGGDKKRKREDGAGGKNKKHKSGDSDEGSDDEEETDDHSEDEN